MKRALHWYRLPVMLLLAIAGHSATAQDDNIDLSKYTEDIRPVNERIDRSDYASAHARALLLKAKYSTPINIKLENINRIVSLRKKCFDRVNSGRVTLAMGDISRRYAFAGAIRKVDEKGITAKISKNWADLDRLEIAAFLRKAGEMRTSDDLIALAAFLMEGSIDEQQLDAALDHLGKAAVLGADVSALVEYVDFLKRVAKAEAEPDVAVKTSKKEEADEARKTDGKAESSTPATGTDTSSEQKKEIIPGWRAEAGTWKVDGNELECVSIRGGRLSTTREDIADFQLEMRFMVTETNPGSRPNGPRVDLRATRYSNPCGMYKLYPATTWAKGDAKFALVPLGWPRTGRFQFFPSQTIQMNLNQWHKLVVNARGPHLHARIGNPSLELRDATLRSGLVSLYFYECRGKFADIKLKTLKTQPIDPKRLSYRPEEK